MNLLLIFYYGFHYYFQNSTNLRTNVLMLVGLCVALPLGLLRKIDSLTSLSALSIAFYVCLILKVSILSLQIFYLVIDF